MPFLWAGILSFIDDAVLEDLIFLRRIMEVAGCKANGLRLAS